MAKKLGISVVAAAALATSAFAANNVADAFKNATMSGEATLFYQSLETSGNDLFSKESAAADAGIKIGMVTAPLDGWQMGLSYYALNTLGLEEETVNGVINKPGAVDGDNDGALNGSWLGEAYMVKSMGNTTVKVGRQKINTPLLNSDGWSVHPNTFNAAVVLNTSIPNVTLVGAKVAQENTRTGGGFNTFYTDGAYGAGAIFSAAVPVKVFYYDITRVAQALYADVSAKMGGVSVAAQYIGMMPEAAGLDDTTAFGVKASGSMGGFGIMGAFTSVSDGALMAANAGDGMTKTPLYTATVLGDADIAGATDTSAFKLSVNHSLGVKGLQVFANYASYTHGDKGYDADSTSAELIAKYKAGNQQLFCMVGSYDHAGGFGAGGDTSDSNTFFRLWSRWSY